MVGRESSSSPEVGATQYVSDPDDSAELFEVLEILDERGGRGVGDYLVQWSGYDPATGRPWSPSWAKKSGCTPGLINEWKGKKKANPEIVGVEKKKFEEREAQKAQDRLEAAQVKKEGTKRKRDSRSKTKTHTTAKRSRVDSRSRTAGTKSRETTATPSETSGAAAARSTRRTAATIGSSSASISPRHIKKSPDAEFAVPAPRPSRLRTRGATISTSNSVEPSEQASRPASPKVTERATRGGGRKPISLGPGNPIAGPGPSTIENRSKEASGTPKKPSRTNNAASSKSPNSRTENPNGEPSSVNTRSAFDSQADPISQFSSPLRSAGKTRHVNPPEPLTGGGLDVESSGNQPSSAENEYEIKAESIDVEVNSARFEKRIIDGEEVLVAVSESLEDDQGSEGEEAPAPVHVIIEVDDEDLDGLDTGDAQKSYGTNQCRWDDCGQNFASSSDLAQHITVHALSFAPDASAVDEESAQQPVLASQEQQSSGISSVPDRSAEIIAELREELERAQAQLQLDEVGELRAEIERLSAQVRTDDIGKLRVRVRELEQQAEESESFRSQVAELNGQHEELSRLRDEVTKLNRELEEIKPLRAQLDDLRRQSVDTPSLNAKIDDLVSQLANNEQRRVTLVEQTSFLREQHSQARDRAVEEVQVANTLRGQVKTLKGQLSNGLKQRDLHRETIHARREEEVAKLRAQNKILQDQARLTDDLIRRKAAQFPSMQRENDELKEILSREQTRNEALSSRNEELRTQFEEMRARQMGLLDGREDSMDSDDDYDSDSDESSRLNGQGFDSTKLELRAPSARLSSAAAAVEVHAVVEDQSATPGSLSAGQAYPCKWNIGETPCRAVFDAIEEVADHARMHQEYDMIVGKVPNYASRPTE